jgi:acyl-CoA thioesterase-1
VVNASISGDTTAGGRSRLPALLKQHRPKVVIIELGGNDALRGLPLASTRDNLDQMVARPRPRAPRCWWRACRCRPTTARPTPAISPPCSATWPEHKAALVPFLLKGVADRPDADAWFQADRIHPLAKAHPILLDNVWPALQPLLR